MARFGIFVGWLFNAVAVVCAAPPVLIFFKTLGRMSEAHAYVVLGFLAIAAGVCFLGRGLRYILGGPTPRS